MSEQTEPVDVVLLAERAAVATRWVPTERVRVRREVVTEEMTVTVSVRREVLCIERHPLHTADGAFEADGADGAGGAVRDSSSVVQAPEGSSAGTAPGPEVLEVVLSAERPVVAVEVVPYERVRLAVRSVASATPVVVDLRREVADITTDVPINDTTEPRIITGRRGAPGAG